MYRYHVEPRDKLYSPREESFPIPLKYIDVSRTAYIQARSSMARALEVNAQACQAEGKAEVVQ